MPRRTHALLPPATALAAGLTLALGVAACGGGSQSAQTLDAPPLTVGTGATLPSTTATTSTTTTTTTSTTPSSDTGGGTGGAVDTGGGTGGTTGGDTGGGTTGGDTGGGATGGATGGGDTGGGGGGTTTPAQPANPGGAAPNYQSFCDENPGAC